MKNIFYTIIGFLALAFMAAGQDLGFSQEQTVGFGASLGCLGFLSNFNSKGFFDAADDFGGGGGGLADLKNKILTGMQSLNEKNKEIEQIVNEKFADIDGKAKGLLEKQAEIVKSFTGLDSDIRELTKNFSEIQAKQAQTRIDIVGDPIKSIQSDDFSRNLFNGLIRKNLSKVNERIILNSDEREALDKFAESRNKSAGDTNAASYIDDHLQRNIYQLVGSFGIWNGFDVVPTATNSEKFPVDTNDPTAVWGVTSTLAEYAGTQQTASVKTAYVPLAILNELLEDSQTDLTSHFATKFARAIAKLLDATCLVADGDDNAVDGGFSGIHDAGTAAVAASGNTTCATTDLEDWTKAMLTVDEGVLKDGGIGKWWMHPHMVIRALSVKDGNGRPIFLNALDAPSPGALGSILGAPVVLCHAGNKTDGASKVIASYGDPMGLAIALRKDFMFATSTDALFLDDKTAFKGRARAGIKVKQATAFANLTTAAS
ncbi:phage major capsid protein [Roseibacillus persicicus]|uniref:phage major capsid protein n=1 Tax=Roseibacillus persicicus TaxID=454148 RepID=UPI00398AD1C8